MPEFLIETQEQLDCLTEWWKAELGLENWEIVASLVDRKTTRGNHGNCEAVEEKNLAVIRILRARDRSSLEIGDALDMEVTLVHELLHCRLAAFNGRAKGDHKDICQEQAVHALSKTLVRMSRKRRSKPRCCLPTPPS